MNTRNIPLTQTEAQQLIDLVDLAVKAGGLQAARVALPLIDKVTSAFSTQAGSETLAA